ncbi:oxygenase MpaB family protein [Amycolatopsis methanolica]|uniref:oxygenase MpaB family protein n=1 Tax=Amycolatopsis methanolica TaxID=1814 RepID=UPI003438CAD9
MTGYWLRRIVRCDPVRDHQEIYRISIGFEFPWDYQRALEFALFRTYCVPSISRLLAATGEFEKRPQKRYDDTALLMAELAENGYDSPRGREALSTINRMHGRYRISNDDMLYVLSTFVHDPIDWIDEFGWRPLHENERQAAYFYFREVGKRMGIKDIPGDYDSFRKFKDAYEEANFGYSEDNNRIGRYTLDLFCAWYPKPLRPAVAMGAKSLLDDRMLAAFGFRPSPAWVGRAARAGLHARSAVVRLLPPRRKSKLLNSKVRSYPGYPKGYSPSDLGAPEPPADIDPALLRRRSR